MITRKRQPRDLVKAQKLAIKALAYAPKGTYLYNHLRRIMSEYWGPVSNLATMQRVHKCSS